MLYDMCVCATVFIRGMMMMFAIKHLIFSLDGTSNCV